MEQNLKSRGIPRTIEQCNELIERADTVEQLKESYKNCSHIYGLDSNKRKYFEQYNEKLKFLSGKEKAQRERNANIAKDPYFYEKSELGISGEFSSGIHAHSSDVDYEKFVQKVLKEKLVKYEKTERISEAINSIVSEISEITLDDIFNLKIPPNEIFLFGTTTDEKVGTTTDEKVDTTTDEKVDTTTDEKVDTITPFNLETFREMTCKSKPIYENEVDSWRNPDNQEENTNFNKLKLPPEPSQRLRKIDVEVTPRPPPEPSQRLRKIDVEVTPRPPPDVITHVRTSSRLRKTVTEIPKKTHKYVVEAVLLKIPSVTYETLIGEVELAVQSDKRKVAKGKKVNPQMSSSSIATATTAPVSGVPYLDTVSVTSNPTGLRCNINSGQVHINLATCSETFHRLIMEATVDVTQPENVDIRRDIGDILSMASKKVGEPRILNDDVWIEFFKLLNYSINMGDCHKDGTPMANLMHFKTHESQFLSVQFGKPQLKRIIHAIEKYLLVTGEIKRVLVARSDKGNEDTYKHFDGSTYMVAYDCGYLGFLRRLLYAIVHSFGKYIDPSSSRLSDINFPKKKQMLRIDRGTFELLGYNFCELTHATCQESDKYFYDFDINKTKLVNTSNDRKQDVHMTTRFVGNAKKNTDDIVSVLGKNMGDKLQVFIQFINYKINKELTGSQICVATCDEVVMMFCIMLNLPCFYTSIDEVDLNGKKDVKVNEILHYDPDGANFGNALKRLIEEYKVVDGEYAHLIKLLENARDGMVSIKGHDKTIRLNPTFADIMINDMNKIRNYITEHIFNKAINYFKFTYKNGDVLTGGVPLVSKDVAMIPLIKQATNTMSAYTTKIIDMFPNPVIKQTGVGRNVITTFNQTTGKYYKYGVNSYNSGVEYDNVILGSVIRKEDILDFMVSTNCALPGANIMVLPFCESAMLTEDYNYEVRGGGVKLQSYLERNDILNVNIFKNVMQKINTKETCCMLDEGWHHDEFSEKPPQISDLLAIPSPSHSQFIGPHEKDDAQFDESKVIPSPSHSQFIGPHEKDDVKFDESKDIHEIEQNEQNEHDEFAYIKSGNGDTRLFFNVHENYYDELFEIYENIHVVGDKIKFPFDEYVSTMESVLFKIRKYDTPTLLREMTNLKHTFLTDFFESEQTIVIILAKIDLLQQIKAFDPTLFKQHVLVSNKMEPTSASASASASESAPNPYEMTDEGLYEKLKGFLPRGLQIKPNILNDENTRKILSGMGVGDLQSLEYGGGGRPRIKTKKRVLRSKWTHKRVQKTKRKMSRHLNKRNKKRHTTR
jgi:hypothetical protein